jgi:hypothetical protein
VIEFVTVERTNGDLVKWQWRFYYDCHTLWLDYYATLERATRRHGFKVTECYRRGGRDYDHQINESDVTLPADVIAEAVEKFCQGITVKRWSERAGASK